MIDHEKALSVQVADWRKEVARLNGLISAAVGEVASPAAPAELTGELREAVRLMVEGYNYGAGYYNHESFLKGMEKLFIASGVYLDESANEYKLAGAPVAEAAPTWIACAKQMPKEWDTVLTCGAKKVGQAVMQWSRQDGWQIETASEWHTSYPPTHWMPLPARPAAPAPGEAQ
jgi:hypothetical protein